MKIRESINQIERERESHEEIFNGEFSSIKENRNQGVTPRSHG